MIPKILHVFSTHGEAVQAMDKLEGEFFWSNMVVKTEEARHYFRVVGSLWDVYSLAGLHFQEVRCEGLSGAIRVHLKALERKPVHA